MNMTTEFPIGHLSPPTPTVRRRVSMRWKLIIAFGFSFTVVFVVVATWFVQFTTGTASDRVQTSLMNVSTGGSLTIDIGNLEAIISDVGPPRPGETYPEQAGTLAGTVADASSTWPTDPRYWKHVAELVRIRSLDPQASPYTFMRDEDGALRFVGSWGATGYPLAGVDQPDGVRLGQYVGDVVPDETVEYLSQGLSAQTAQPVYTDEFGTWISAYTPLFDDDGALVGGLGVDYEASYVDQIRQRSIRQLYPVLAVSYVALLGLVTFLSGRMTHRLARLSGATQRIAGGDYQVDISDSAKSRWVDEMTELAESFAVMAERVGARERSLAQQVAVLKVEIDQSKREAAVAEITDSDFFSELSAKAERIRARVKENDEKS